MKTNHKPIHKILGFVLCLSMLFCSAIPVHAINNAKINVSSTTSYQGSIASIQIRLDDNPGIWGIKMKVDYNHDTLTLKTVRNGSIFSDDDVTMSSNLNVKEFVYVASRDDLNNIEKNGILVSLDFKVSDKAIYGSYPVSVTVSQIINVDGADVNCQTTNGTIDIIKKPIINTSTNTKPSTNQNNKNESNVSSNDNSTKVIDVLKGQNSQYVIGSEQSIEFVCDDESQYFIRVEVDGKVIDEKNYKLEGSQLKVILLPEYLETLSEGEHTLSIYTQNGVATTSFTIVKDDVANQSDEENTSTEKGNLPTLYIIGGVGIIALAIVALYISKERSSQ